MHPVTRAPHFEKTKPTWPWIILLIAVAALLRGPGMVSEPMWVDEALTWRDSSDLTAMMQWRHNSLHPPLSYLLVYASRLVTGTDAPWALRLPSFIASLLAVPAFYLAGRRLFCKNVGLIAALLATVDPILIDQGEQARMYSIYVLATVLLVWHLAGYSDRRRRKLTWWIPASLLLAACYWSWGMAAPIIAALGLGVPAYLTTHRTWSPKKLDLNWPNVGNAVLIFVATCHVGLTTSMALLLRKIALTGKQASMAAPVETAEATGPGFNHAASAPESDGVPLVLSGLRTLVENIARTLSRIFEMLTEPYGLPYVWLGLLAVALASLAVAAIRQRRYVHWVLLFLPLAGLLVLVPFGIKGRDINPRYLITIEIGMLIGVAVAIAQSRHWAGRGAPIVLTAALAGMLGVWGMRDLDHVGQNLGPIIESHSLATDTEQVVLQPWWRTMRSLSSYYGLTGTHPPVILDQLDLSRPTLLVLGFLKHDPTREESIAVCRRLSDLYGLGLTPERIDELVPPQGVLVIWMKPGEFDVLRPRRE